MSHKRFWTLFIGLSVSLFCLVGCMQKEQLPIDAVKNFLNAINSFDCEDLDVNDPYASEEFIELSEAYQNYTTYSGASEDAFTLMLCAVQFVDMEYEIVYRDDLCSVIKATGVWREEDQEDLFEEEWIVVKDVKGWVIDIDADSCEE